MKVFISSTFCDLESERSYIVRNIFPLIRSKFKGIEINEVDLRWGITASEARSGLVTDLCLRYLHDARPFFIGIIGDRYGSIFDASEIKLSNFVKNTYPEVERDIHDRKSITEIEILNGLLRNNDNDIDAIFFIKRGDLGEPYPGESTEQYRKLQNLKSTIRNQRKYKVVEYSSLADFDCIEKFISNKIETNKLYHSEQLHKRLENTLRRMIALRDRYRLTQPSSPTCMNPIIDGLEKSTDGIIAESFSGMGLSTALSHLGEKFDPAKPMYIHLYGDVIDLPVHYSDFVEYFILAAKHQLAEFEKAGCQVMPKEKGFMKWLFSDLRPTPSLENDETLYRTISSYKWRIVLDNPTCATTLGYNSMAAIASYIQVIRRQLSYRNINVDLKVMYATSTSDNNKPRLPVVKTMLQGAFDRERFFKSYLSGFSKKLDHVQLQNIIRSPVAANPSLAKLLCDYLREYTSFEDIEATTTSMNRINTGTDVVNLFINECLNVGKAEYRYVAHMLWIHQSGITQPDMMNGIDGLDRMKVNMIFSILTRFMNQSDDRSYYMKNIFYLTAILQKAEYDRDYCKELAQKNVSYFFNKFKNYKTAEHFLLKTQKEGWWLYADAWMKVIPEEIPDRLRPIAQTAFGIGNRGASRDHARLSLIQAYGGFSIDNAHKVFEAYRSGWAYKVSTAKTDLIRIAKKKGTEIDQKRWDNIIAAERECRMARNPTRHELLNYLETLLYAENTKGLSVQLGNPIMMNYIWNTPMYLGAWYWLRNHTGEWIIQDDIRTNGLVIKGLMAKVAYLLGDQKALDYYSEPAKQ